MEDIGCILPFQNSSIHDVEFFTICFKAAKILLNFEERDNAEYLNRYYEIFKQHFDIFFEIRTNPGLKDDDTETIKFLKDTLYYRIIYVLRNSPIVASAVAFHFQNALKEDLSFLSKLVKKRKIKICSIGGGSASDVLAVVQILDSIAIKLDIRLDFRVTIIDSNSNWKTTCFTVLSCLKYFHGATGKIKFIEADISDKNSYCPEALKAIQKADIVLMVMRLYDFQWANLNASQIVKDLCEIVQYDSMLFVLDLASIKYIKICFGISAEIENYRLIYEDLCQYHVLEDKARENFHKSYLRYFKELRNAYDIHVFARAWIKTQTKIKYNSINISQHRFNKTIECYNPIKIFLNRSAFEAWKITYVDSKNRVGWTKKDIQESLQEREMERKNLLAQVTESMELLESARKELVNKNRQLVDGDINGPDKIDAAAWEKYVMQMKEYCQMKKSAYEYFIFGNNIP